MWVGGGGPADEENKKHKRSCNKVTMKGEGGKGQAKNSMLLAGRDGGGAELSAREKDAIREARSEAAKITFQEGGVKKSNRRVILKEQGRETCA